MNKIAERIESLAAESWSLANREGYNSWSTQVSAFLRAALGQSEASDFDDLADINSLFNWSTARDRQAGHLEGLALALSDETDRHRNKPSAPSDQSLASHRESNKVFLVHGHDSEAKEVTARFIEKLKLTPIILHEQSNQGRTVIEKFEAHADVGFAVVLLTADDVGASDKAREDLKSRARQNVILELGYFIGKLGRRRVCALVRPGVEIPSDLHGVLYVELDQPGAWKAKLAQELIDASMKVDLNGLLSG